HVDSKVKVSVLCPAWVNTQLMDAERNRPADLQNEAGTREARPQAMLTEQAVRALVAGGTNASVIADRVVDAIREERLYVLPHQEWKEQVRTRMEGIIDERNPSTEPAIQAVESS
ncbi:MAG TPA: hypothetical protein VIT93_01445, partial [Dehalococcoidia bacterium]